MLNMYDIRYQWFGPIVYCPHALNAKQRADTTKQVTFRREQQLDHVEVICVRARRKHKPLLATCRIAWPNTG
jgi:hypothetical protein